MYLYLDSVLHLKKNYPVLLRIIKYQAFFQLILAILMFAYPYWGSLICYGTANIFHLSVVVILSYLSIKGNISARLILVGASSFLISIIIYILYSFNILPSNIVTDNILIFGNIIEILFSSLALSNKINTFRKEKEKAQEQAIFHANENQRILREQNALLEKTVTEKTSDILASYNKLVSISSKLKESEIKLIELNAAKDKFFSIIGHDLKSPFNSIIGFSEVLLEQIMANNYKGIDEYARIIHQSSNKAMNLLMNLMEWAQSQTGGLMFNRENIEIKSFVDDLTQLYEEIAKQKAITIKKMLPNNANVFADKAMIITIFRNLISNALKFTKPSGEIIVSAKKKQNELIFSVADTGIGIPQNSIERLFRIDQSFSTNGTNNEKGTGLGLILCKEYIEKHGGKIWVESEEGKGTTFSFTLPMNN
jgi:signal transduction histidine kinase